MKRKGWPENATPRTEQARSRANIPLFQETFVKQQFILPAALLLALGATTALTAPGVFAQAPAATSPGNSDANLGPAPWDPQQQAQQGATRPGTQQPGQRQHDRTQGQNEPRRRFDFTARAEARIAYVKSELKITPAQEAAFDKYAQAIRDNAATTQKSFEDMRAQRGQPGQNQSMSAIDRVEQRAKMAQMRDQEQQKYLAAFRPLYASLSPDQKKIADQLATPQRHFGRFGHFGPGRG
jgi:hypothetical protein